MIGYVFIALVVLTVLSVWVVVVYMLYKTAAINRKVEKSVRDNYDGIKYLSPEDKQWLDDQFDISK